MVIFLQKHKNSSTNQRPGKGRNSVEQVSQAWDDGRIDGRINTQIDKAIPKSPSNSIVEAQVECLSDVPTRFPRHTSPSRLDHDLYRPGILHRSDRLFYELISINFLGICTITVDNLQW